MSLCIKKEINYSVGLFKIGSVILNEKETWENDNVKPICADNDFMLHFKPSNSKGVHAGKKHFRSIEEAETYISMLVLNGFSIDQL